MTTVAVVYHSATGRTKALAEAAVRGAARVERTETRLLAVDDNDPRMHAVLATADAIIFGCPTYMGSASAGFKAFMDSTSAIWALQGWRDKLAAAFTHSAALSGDKLGTLTQLAVFAAQHGMVWIGLGLPPTYASVESSSDETNRLGSHLGAMAQSRPGGSAVPAGDLLTAELLGRRVAEAARRWNRPMPLAAGVAMTQRHNTARGWSFPRRPRGSLPNGIERVNLREIAARPERFEHHLVVCASVDGAQLELTTASEPLYFAHINVSDEYAIALPSGDELVDRFPLRTFLSDATTGTDAGRYNHRIGDLVLHPEGWLHWPGRLRPPYEPFDFPPGMRRAGLSLVYCANANRPTPSTACPLPTPSERMEDVKVYTKPEPPMALASLRSGPRTLATIGATTLLLVDLPASIAPAHGGWVLVLEAASESEHAACDLYRVAEGARLDGKGIVRALVLLSDARAPDPVPPSWAELPPPAFVPFEDGLRGRLPFSESGIEIRERDGATVTIRVGAMTTEVPRYWLARMLFRVALHRLRMGYVETYGGFFVDDRGDEAVRLGIRIGQEKETLAVTRTTVMDVIERMYRAVAPSGYVERPG